MNIKHRSRKAADGKPRDVMPVAARHRIVSTVALPLSDSQGIFQRYPLSRPNLCQEVSGLGRVCVSDLDVPLPCGS